MNGLRWDYEKENLLGSWLRMMLGGSDRVRLGLLEDDVEWSTVGL